MSNHVRSNAILSEMFVFSGSPQMTCRALHKTLWNRKRLPSLTQVIVYARSGEIPTTAVLSEHGGTYVSCCRKCHALLNALCRADAYYRMRCRHMCSEAYSRTLNVFCYTLIVLPRLAEAHITQPHHLLPPVVCLGLRTTHVQNTKFL